MIDYEKTTLELKKAHTHGFIENCIDQSSVQFDDVMDNILTMSDRDIHYNGEVSMYEMHRLETYDWTPKHLMDLRTRCLETTLLKGSHIIAFAAETADLGYGWHSDLFDIMVTNVCGSSTWTFEDEEVIMNPFDVMFVPKGVRHTVRGHGPRFTAAIGNNRG